MSLEDRIQEAEGEIVKTGDLLEQLRAEIDAAEVRVKANAEAVKLVDTWLPDFVKRLEKVEDDIPQNAPEIKNRANKAELSQIEKDAADLAGQVDAVEDADDAVRAEQKKRIHDALDSRIADARNLIAEQNRESVAITAPLAKANKALKEAAKAIAAGELDKAEAALDDAEKDAQKARAAVSAAKHQIVVDTYEQGVSEAEAKIATARADLKTARASAPAQTKAQNTSRAGKLPPLKDTTTFPDSITGSNMKVVNASPGGTTGAQIVEIDGQKFVLKQNGRKISPEHIRNEAAADAAYRRAGIRVPECRIYEEGGKTYKLSKFIDGGKSLGDYLAKATPKQREAALEQLAQGYPLDALFGNRDAYGTAGGAWKGHDFDNILVDKDGNVWRIDNGSAFGFRAQGAKKDAADWEKREWPDEWRSLRQHNPDLFGNLDAHAIFANFNRLDVDAAIRDLPDATKKALAKPLEEMRQMGARCADFDRGGYISDATSFVLETSYDMSKAGLRESMPTATINAHRGSSPAGVGWLRPSSVSGRSATQGVSSDAAHIVMEASKSINYHIAQGDNKPNMGKVHAATALKNDLELAAPHDANAKKLLAAVNIIEKSAASKFTINTPLVDSSLSVDWSKVPGKSAPTTGAYSCFAEAIEDFARKNGTEAKRATELFDGQGGSSSSMGSCKAKVIEMMDIGIDPSNPPASVYSRSSLQHAVSFYKTHPKELELDRKAYHVWKSATQLLLENCDIPRADKGSRTIRLCRTMDSAIKKYNPVKGEIMPFIPEGAHESYSADWVVVISGSHAVMRDVPFSRVSSISYSTTSSGGDLYLGDSENEVGANTIGLPCVYMGGFFRSGDPVDPFDAVIDAAEKKSGMRMRDFKVR